MIDSYTILFTVSYADQPDVGDSALAGALIAVRFWKIASEFKRRTVKSLVSLLPSDNYQCEHGSHSWHPLFIIFNTIIG